MKWIITFIFIAINVMACVFMDANRFPSVCFYTYGAISGAINVFVLNLADELKKAK